MRSTTAPFSAHFLVLSIQRHFLLHVNKHSAIFSSFFDLQRPYLRKQVRRTIWLIFLRLTTAPFLAHFLDLSRRDNNGWICPLTWISSRTLVTYFLCHLQMNNGSRASVPNDDFGAKPVWYHSPKKEKGRKWPLKMKIYCIFGWKYKLKFDTCLNWMAEFFSQNIYFTHILPFFHEKGRKLSQIKMFVKLKVGKSQT